MDVFHFSPVIFTLPLFLLSLLWISKLLLRNTNRKPKAPEARGAWPIIGHLHLLRGPQPLHIILATMADKYGPIFTIQLGVRRALVVSDSETVKECFTSNDKAFATRPRLTSSVHMGYNCAMIGFAPYGPYWRQVRKFATLELLSNNRLDLLKPVRESEIKLSLQELYQQWSKSKNSSDKLLVEMKRWFADLTLNLILRMIVGKRIPMLGNDAESNILKKGMKDLIEFSGKFVAADAFPFLSWLDIGGDEKAMKKVAKELDRFVEGWLQEHMRKKSSGELKGGEDFMDVMLSTFTDMGEHNSDTINKANCLALVLAAADTTAVTLTWALSLLLNNDGVLKKARNELDIHVGKENRLVNETDMKNLVYLQAIIKETLRLYPAAPLSLFHAATEDCTVSGYRVSAGTWLISNIYKLQRDPAIWSEPCEFRPERFLTSHRHVDVRGQNFELIPFGSGRRMCPGVSYALQVLQLTLANLLHLFDFATPMDEPIDMMQGAALTLCKATPLEVLVTPRLSAFVYESTSLQV